MAVHGVKGEGFEDQHFEGSLLGRWVCRAWGGSPVDCQEVQGASLDCQKEQEPFNRRGV